MSTATGTLINRDSDSNLVSQILMTTTLKPPFKIKPMEADGGRRVHRGATHLAELIIERDTGFMGDILLDMSAAQSRHRQGIHGPPLTIVGDIRKVEYPVFVPEVLETARTSRIGLIAMTRIPDPKGQPAICFGERGRPDHDVHRRGAAEVVSDRWAMSLCLSDSRLLCR